MYIVRMGGAGNGLAKAVPIKLAKTKIDNKTVNA